MKYMALILLAVLQVIIGVTLSYKRRSKISKWFALFASTLAVWTLFNVSLDYYQYQGFGSIQLLVYLNKLGFFWGILALVCVYRLTVVFPIEKAGSRLTRVMTALGILLAVLSALVEPISGYFYHETGEAIAVYTYGALVPLVGLYALVLIGLCIQNIAHVYRKSVDKSTKSQATLLFAGLILTVLLAIMFITVIPVVYPDKESLIFVGYFAPFIFAASMFYSIFVQKFLDFRLVVARSMGYLMSLIFLGVLYGVLAFVALERWLLGAEVASDPRQRALYVLLALVSGLSFAPAKRVFDRLSNQIFYRDAYDPQNFLDQFNKHLISSGDIEALLTKSAGIITENIKSEYALFGLKETDFAPQRIIGNTQKDFGAEDIRAVRAVTPHTGKVVLVTDELDDQPDLKKKLRKYDIALMARLTPEADSEQEGLGYLVLGQKRSGNPYNKQDVQIIEIIANELVIAIQNALRYEEIEKFNITLQQKVDSATRQLRRSNEKLKSMDETKDEFISMASHQLRTPLTSVKGYVSMVLEGDAGELNEQQKQLLGQAFISSQHMNYLISDLLNVSRLRTGKFVIEPTPVYLPDLVEGEVSQLRETARAKGLELGFVKPQEFPTLELDETKTRQVVMNFIDNALHYTPSGGKVHVELEAKPKSIEFRVVDTGLGVAKEEQHKLFTKFFRADNARQARPDGTGLGLFMAKKVIIAQGGAIVFHSKEGQGSTFGFTFSKHL